MLLPKRQVVLEKPFQQSSSGRSGNHRGPRLTGRFLREALPEITTVASRVALPDRRHLHPVRFDGCVDAVNGFPQEDGAAMVLSGILNDGDVLGEERGAIGLVTTPFPSFVWW
ncbi:hypothetical protein, unlikely [Trypanosoma congolense IL3000]|uniref:Uncharacterized protein n=1 Tax=Trypanosoma congolense (strain IL3000) TaxID=1068625 RepID=F9W9F1_TRYCI|nr:hypothetical protein, unlikely [Trypanosoma congolense IL3000]